MEDGTKLVIGGRVQETFEGSRHLQEAPTRNNPRFQLRLPKPSMFKKLSSRGKQKTEIPRTSPLQQQRWLLMITKTITKTISDENNERREKLEPPKVVVPKVQQRTGRDTESIFILKSHMMFLPQINKAKVKEREKRWGNLSRVMYGCFDCQDQQVDHFLSQHDCRTNDDLYDLGTGSSIEDTEQLSSGTDDDGSSLLSTFLSDEDEDEDATVSTLSYYD